MGAIENALQRVLANYHTNPKNFWGEPEGLSLGAGLFYEEIAYPLLDISTKKFDTVAGPVLVLTHECDIDRANSRRFNEEILICPIYPFGDVVQSYIAHSSMPEFEGFLVALAKNQVNRLLYVPSISSDILPHGGILYLNQLCSTHISMFDSKNPSATLTALGLNILDLKMRNHLFRPKEQLLPLTHSYASRFLVANE